MYIVCDDEWITPIKYDRDILNFPFCLFSGATTERAHLAWGVTRSGCQTARNRLKIGVR